MLLPFFAIIRTRGLKSLLTLTGLMTRTCLIYVENVLSYLLSYLCFHDVADAVSPLVDNVVSDLLASFILVTIFQGSFDMQDSFIWCFLGACFLLSRFLFRQLPSPFLALPTGLLWPPSQFYEWYFPANGLFLRKYHVMA